jgi:hypothetical protein
MPLYFLVHDAARFHHVLRPALAAARQGRDFAPCRPLCKELLAAAHDFLPDEARGTEPTFLRLVAEGLTFDRDLWRSLVGEVLLYAAVELPEIQTAAGALSCLASLGPLPDPPTSRPCENWVQQVHFGARDLTFGGVFYRPEAAGWNDTHDVARLSEHLRALEPDHWRADALRPLTDLSDDEDRADELAFVRDWLPPLRDMYDRARAGGQVVICEKL